MKNNLLELNLNEINISFDESYHVYKENPLYKNRFTSVMSFHPPGVAAVQDGNIAYHINLKGEPIYERKFLKTFGYYLDIAAVQDNSGWYHIDLSGSPIYNERYDWVGNFQEDRCTVRENSGDFCHVKKDGRFAYEEKYRYAGDYK
ncbi:MAG: hypothetical protein ACFFD2_27675, partial [Promethearchaeota archaeon]